MKGCSFKIAITKDCPEFDIPEPKWMAPNGLDLNLCASMVVIEIDYEQWDRPISEKPTFFGSDIALLILNRWLGKAMCMYGRTFDIERFSPKQLFEALSNGWEYQWEVLGDVPTDPFSKPGPENPYRYILEWRK